MNLHLYSFYHLNLAYSAIEEEDYEKVINNCYWPLLHIPKKLKVPIGIEVPGYTLELIYKIDKAWCLELRKLIKAGACELIGCGYAQVISPLVPRRVSEANIYFGNEVYSEILGVVPAIALINEQALSRSVPSIYKENGYDTIIVEWENTRKNLDILDSETEYLSQKIETSDNEYINIIWNKSICFQKFQRYVHGEDSINDITNYIKSKIRADKNRCQPLYGNDVEIFDYRPGRYMTEATLHKDGEWERIYKLYENLQRQNHIKFISPSEVLSFKTKIANKEKIKLMSPETPIMVKKQSKYNATRWAVTGRDDSYINSLCFRIYKELKTGEVELKDQRWKELCYLWSSDYRTHITQKRWEKFIERLNLNFVETKNCSSNISEIGSRKKSQRVKLEEDNRFITASDSNITLVFDKAKGLAIRSYIDRRISPHSIYGTIEHGYFSDIAYAADFFSGHLVIEIPGEHKVTDLARVSPVISTINGEHSISCSIKTHLGVIHKKITLDHLNALKIEYRLLFKNKIKASIRAGYVTMNYPDVANESLYFATHNGGDEIEYFRLDKDFDHSQHLSLLLSNTTCCGMTEEKLEIGNDLAKVITEVDFNQSYAVGMVTNRTIDNKKLFRSLVSIREIDDTSKPNLIDTKISLRLCVEKI